MAWCAGSSWRRALTVALLVSLAGACLIVVARPAPAVTTTANDVQRTGWYPNQPNLTPSIVSGPTFGRRWRTALTLTPGEQVFAQPLVSNGTICWCPIVFTVMLPRALSRSTA